MSLSWRAAFVGQGGPVGIVAAETAHDVGERAGHEEVFLREPKLLSALGGIVRVEHAGQRMGSDGADDGADKIAGAELAEVELALRGRLPEAQRVDGLAAEADHWPVVRDAHQRRGPTRHQTQRPVMYLQRAAERDIDGLAGSRDLPGVLLHQPRVRLLVLPAVDDGLPEHAVLVAQPVADRGELHRRHRFEEARRQPAETAIAEPGIRLLLDHGQQIDAGLIHQGGDLRLQEQVRDVVRQRSADQEFER